jgi:5,6,7,8-tetrahydromethanopterin hydro-lyase
VADGVLSEADADELLLIAAVWVDPKADDVSAVFANNREATRGALSLGRANLPSPRAAVDARDQAWNPYFRPAT